MVFPIKKMVARGPIHEFRPITLTSVFRRLFESGLLQAFSHNPTLKQASQLSPLQAAFRNRHSCYDQILTLHNATQGDPEHLVFIDFKNAYDTVDLPRLWAKLTTRGVPSQMGRLLEAMFTFTCGRAVVNGRLSPGFTRTRGVLQGSLLSPLLFNLYIDDLADALSAAQIDGGLPSKAPPALFFADDIVLVIRSYRITAIYTCG
eukprot:comp24345_c0_seq3/m.46428 comp24345_c0_seq3/g.46428  ORF comp24345_c0_seq3/g.46428 comp24345_c0_seq3/m.46428 type:complete len:204 (-) comp24345_c0_seq3:221-832(-)